MIYSVVFYLRIAKENLVLHKARMTLALLGILFAVMSLFAFGNISTSMKLKIDKEIGRFGKNLVIVRSGLVMVTGRGARQFAESKSLKLGDAVRIKEQLPGVQYVAPYFDLSYTARYRENSMKVTLVGTPDDIFKIRNINLIAGRQYSKTDEQRGAKTAVIGYKIFDNLFIGEDPIGKYLLIQRVPTEVIGVMEEKGADISGQDEDIQAFIPLTSFMRRYSNVDYIKGIYIQAQDGVPLSLMKKRVSAMLRKLHGLQEGQKDDFSIFTMDDILRTKEEGIRLVGVLNVIASTVSFVIGGLGIFAIMLLSVFERKMEIGIRRVVGSKNIDIIIQFLTESLVTALLGSTLGICIGFILTYIVDVAGEFPFYISLTSLLLSIFISAFVGIAAGIYPAIQGTKYEPVKALYQ